MVIHFLMSMLRRHDDVTLLLLRLLRFTSGMSIVIRFNDHVPHGVQSEEMAGYKGKWRLPYCVFQTHLLVNGWLHKLAPKLFQDPNFVPMMTIQTSSYSNILKRIRTPFYSLASAFAVILGMAVIKIGMHA